MLQELAIANFAIIEKVTLSFGLGLNVLTGETGAGKSIIVDALGLLLGGRATADALRAGAEEARVEGIFSLGGAATTALLALLAAHGLEGEEDTLILSRQIHREGRHICRANGRAVPLHLFAQIGEALVDMHGQSEHLSLAKPASHGELLDRYGKLLEERGHLAEGLRELRKLRFRLAKLAADERELARREELLAYQVKEIAAAKLIPGEEEELKQKRDILAHAERIIELAERAYGLLKGEEGGGPGALDLLGQVQMALRELARLNPGMAGESELGQRLSAELEELARNLQGYTEGLDYSPAHLEEIETRLALIYNLKRKYGASIAEVLAFAQAAAQELEAIAHREEEMARLQSQEAELLPLLGSQAAELSRKREEAGEALAREMERELAELAMAGCSFRVEMRKTPSADGLPVDGERLAFGESGIDQVEFLISPNPGEPLRPLARIASGGELARMMLALKTILASSDHTPTLIFDEIDSGVGGRLGQVLGRKLWGLGRSHQVIVTTHLPQLAAFADRHFLVRKVESAGRTLTQVEELRAEEERLAELTAMQGMAGEASRQSARELRAEAEGWKGPAPAG